MPSSTWSVRELAGSTAGRGAASRGGVDATPVCGPAGSDSLQNQYLDGGPGPPQGSSMAGQYVSSGQLAVKVTLWHQKTRPNGRVLRSKRGADEGIRTPDPRFTKALLYP